MIFYCFVAFVALWEINKIKCYKIVKLFIHIKNKFYKIFFIGWWGRLPIKQKKIPTLSAGI